MKLYFLRHADALHGMDDEIRPLSPQGKHECKVVGQFLKKAGIRFDAAYSSPFLRARETAEIILEVCGSSNQTNLKMDHALLNETSQDVFVRWLSDLKKARHVLLVGHAPVLADRARKLLGSENSRALSLPKCGMICLETSDCHQAGLVFMISPDILDAQGAFAVSNP